MDGCGALRLVLADQLTRDVAALKGLDPERDVVLMAEVMEEATYVRHHKQKLVFLFSAMRNFAAGSTRARQRLVDWAKLLLASGLSRRWTLAEIASRVGGSPVYLTQAFQQVEGMPLYRYHLRLRLARALDLIADCEDVAALAVDLGFSSHSHFSAAFRQAYGRTPSEFREAALARKS